MRLGFLKKPLDLKVIQGATAEWRALVDRQQVRWEIKPSRSLRRGSFWEAQVRTRCRLAFDVEVWTIAHSVDNPVAIVPAHPNNDPFRNAHRRVADGDHGVSPFGVSVRYKLTVLVGMNSQFDFHRFRGACDFFAANQHLYSRM
jgi:hypothetical protein